MLAQMVERADEYGIKLTLMFTAQWADYIAESPARLAELHSWAENGHEIAAHHHSVYHGNWDGYTDYSPAEAIAQREKRDKKPEPYLGTLDDYIEKLRQINPDIHSGCMNSEHDKNSMPDPIIYDTCSGFANFGPPGRRLADGASPEKGKNEYISTGTFGGIQRWWLAHYQITVAQRQQQAQAVFNSMDSGVYGSVTHSIPDQAPPYYDFLEFLHEKDPSAAGSRTLSEVIEQKLIPECQLPDELLNAGGAATPPSQPAQMGNASDSGLASPFGIFGAYALEYASFQERMDFDAAGYWDWVDGHFQELGARWTRSNLQLIWDSIEPQIGRSYRWQNKFRTDDVITRISQSPADVHWVGVFHEGGQSPDTQKSPLRDPLDYPDEYARFVKAVVERYDGDGIDDLAGITVKYWQIGNEYPGWERQGRTLEQYMDWVKLASSAIKEADPDARVVLIAETQGFTLKPWLEQAIEELAPSGDIDVVDIHHWGKAVDWKMPVVPQVCSLLDELGRPDMEIFSCEHGTWAGDPIGQPAQSEEEQARSLVKRYVYNLNNGLDKLFWNNLMEWDAFGGQEGSIFNSMGLISDGLNSGDTPDRFNTPRIAYWSYYLLAHHLGNDITGGERLDTGDNDVYLYRFPAGDNGGIRFVGWSEKGTAGVVITQCGFSGRSFTLIPDRYGDCGNQTEVSAGTNGEIRIELGIDPLIIIEGN